VLITVTGMRREARIFSRGCDVVVSGGRNSALAEKIEQAVARGGEAIVSAGICGGLSPNIAVGTVVIGSEIVWNGTRIPTDEVWVMAIAARIQEGICGAIAGSDTIVGTPAAKAALHRETGALAADMESYIAAQVAARHGLPFAALRTVSDGANDTLPAAVSDAIGSDGDVRTSVVLGAVARNPLQIPTLIRLARNTNRAMASLLRCFNLLGPGLGCPYLG
jgi:adenosylhomocysteine nucleosidase